MFIDISEPFRLIPRKLKSKRCCYLLIKRSFFFLFSIQFLVDSRQNRLIGKTTDDVSRSTGTSSSSASERAWGRIF